VTIPSLASVYNEFALKKHMDTSVLLQNFFLYFYGAAFNALGLLLFMAFGAMTPATFFQGFTGVSEGRRAALLAASLLCGRPCGLVCQGVAGAGEAGAGFCF
jgi:hypothetical protein